MRIRDFLIIDEIGKGGFGSAYRALQERAYGQRIVIVKTIRKELSAKKEFNKDFINEIKLAFPLNHQNIAQIYEYGRSAGQLYYILEYVEGPSLRKLQIKLQQYKQELPIPYCLHVVIEAAKGLDFAHHFRDQLNGKMVSIIHRDISPHNIMVSYQGSVKVIDFGIAKAQSKTDHGRTGVFKGKPAYMPPEYILGAHFDHRFDQFSLGVVLWELLTGRKLFTGRDKYEVLQKIAKCEIPLPRLHNSKISHELQEAVLRMLNKNPRKRFHTMAQAQSTLQRIMAVEYSNFSPMDFAQFIQQYFRSDIKWEQARLRRLIHQVKESSENKLSNLLKKTGT
jgi:serine/threonine protein kinase